MGTNEARKAKGPESREQRHKRRIAIFAALETLEQKDVLNWKSCAAALNKRGVRNEFGRAWSARSAALFAQKNIAGRKMRGTNSAVWTVLARGIGKVSRVEEVRQLCFKAASYEQAADILNLHGIVTPRGERWSGKLVKQLAQRHPDQNLVPLVGKKGRTRFAGLVVKALKGVKRDDCLTWEGIALELTAKGVVCPGGGRWSGKRVARFVERHRRQTGEALLPWKKPEGKAEARYLGGVLERRARDILAERILAVCGGLSEERAVQKLNRAGVKTRMGNVWTPHRLRVFLRLYENSRKEEAECSSVPPD